MANLSNKFSGDQADIFQGLEMPAMEGPYSDLDITLDLQAACKKAYKLAERRGMSVNRLVDELNRLMPRLHRPITQRKVYSWLALSKEDHPIPAYVIPAWCVATRCDFPLRVMANEIGFELSDQNELLAQELGHQELQRANSARRIRELKSKLGNK
jgi:hypothetical protein